MNKTYLLVLDPEWMKDKTYPEDNAIIRWLGTDYDINSQRMRAVVELIGNPVQSKRDVVFITGPDNKLHEQVIPENV